MNRTVVVCALLSASLTAPAVAFLGIGDIVYDPSNYAQAIQQLAQLEQQYAQLVETYQMIKSQYDHMVRMAQRVPVNMIERYRARGTPWHNSSAANAYGSSGGWIEGINTGIGVAGGYARATQELVPTVKLLRTCPALTSRALKPTTRLSSSPTARTFMASKPWAGCAPTLCKSKGPSLDSRTTHYPPARR